MFTILGAGGAIGNEVAKTFFQQKAPFTLVSRHTRSVYGGLTLAADLTSRSQTDEAVRGSTHVLLCPGLKYDLKIWEKRWPLILTNTIEACKRNNVKLIFFDNVYMLGKVDGQMTEETPNKPVSKKGFVREKLVDQVWDEINKGNLVATIARAADFYGPRCENSVLNKLVLDKLSQGSKAQWLVNAKVPHSFTFTPDCGKAIWEMYNSDDCWNQVWNMPTAKPALTGEQLINLAAKKFNISPGYSVIGSGMISLLGLFMTTMKEMKEMLYQYSDPYEFDSQKFEKAFKFRPTPYEEGIDIIVEDLRNPKKR